MSESRTDSTGLGKLCWINMRGNNENIVRYKYYDKIFLEPGVE